MYYFSQKSEEALATCHPEIQKVMRKAIKLVDFSVLEGARSEERQQELYDDGKSKTLDSNHLVQSDGWAHAVDIAPYPIDWEDEARFAYLAGIVTGIASSKGINLRWGHDWDRDGDIRDQGFNDSPHFERIGS